MMENFSEELFAKIKSIQALLKGGADPCASTLNLGADVDLATLADQDVLTLTQKIEKIKNDVNLLDFTASLKRSNSINEEKNTPSEEQISPLLTDQDQKLEQTKLGEDGEAVKEWKDLRRFVVISEKGNYQHGIKRTYRCTICGFLETNSASQMQDHVETAHFKGAFKYNCPFCERQFQSRCTFKRHKRKVHKVKQELDEVSTNTESETIIGNAVDPKEADDTNPNCVKVWNDFRKFIRVKEKGKSGRHGKRSTLWCSICDHTNAQRSHLMNHIERAHFRDTFVYKCPVCGSSPTTRHALECHMREKHNKSRKDWSGLDVVKTNDCDSNV